MRFLLAVLAYAVAVLGSPSCILTIQVVSNSGFPIPDATFRVSERGSNGVLRSIAWKQGEPLPQGHYEIRVYRVGFVSEVVGLELASDELHLQVGLTIGSIGGVSHSVGQWFDRGTLPDDCDRISLVPRFSPSAPRVFARLALKGKTYVQGFPSGLYLVITESSDRACAIELHNVGYGKDGISIALGRRR